jgi:NAD+ synthase (glutamine-hydrolysing)
MDFFSPYAHEFVRIAACVPRLAVADPIFNADETLALLKQGHEKHVGLMVFPELGLSAYAIDDLLLQDALLDAVQAQLRRLVDASRGLFPAFAVGAPLRYDGRLYNCAVVIHRGSVLGVVPKTFLPNYREFYERRWFTSGAGLAGLEIEVAGGTAPFGVDMVFESKGACPFTFHVEICEDVWVADPPSTGAALAGAEVLVNLSASNIVIGKANQRRLLCGSQSSRCLAAYAYSAAGPGESTTDLAWDGHASIFELGKLLSETERFPAGAVMTVADVDVGRIRQERMRTGTLWDVAAVPAMQSRRWRRVGFDLAPPKARIELQRTVERFPYTPSDPAALAENCYEAFNIQVQGLAKRIETTRGKKLVIGISGGLDSTHALIVATKAMDRLGLPRSDIHGYTLPGFATSDTTKSNAWALMKTLGITAAELDIKPAALQMLKDLDHPYARGEPVYDITFENVQAGLRTDYLFRLANKVGGFVVGTGDLSELGLGWCTYGVGDHMSHYNPNGGVPKTLIQHLIRFVANSGDVSGDTSSLLHAILEQEISPELIPGEAAQSTEASVGPYALQDFNLYYLTRYGFRPSKIAYLAWNAWRDRDAGHWPANTPESARRAYDLATIKGWLRLFLQRFFANQFKRSALPNGPKISSGGSLSPRGDWRMPSDASPRVWLEELERVPEESQLNKADSPRPKPRPLF